MGIRFFSKTKVGLLYLPYPFLREERRSKWYKLGKEVPHSKEER